MTSRSADHPDRSNAVATRSDVAMLSQGILTPQHQIFV